MDEQDARLARTLAEARVDTAVMESLQPGIQAVLLQATILLHVGCALVRGDPQLTQEHRARWLREVEALLADEEDDEA